MSSTPTGRVSHSPITPDNHSPIIEIALYFLMVTFILAVMIRFAIRLGIAKSVSRDDWVSLGSMVAGIGQVISVALGVHYGLGKQERLLNQDQILGAEKAQYAADWFYLTALCLAKVSVLLLLQRLAVERIQKRIALATVGVVGLWSLAGVIVLAARCGATFPWNVSSPTQCINMRTFWIGMAPVDILTELVAIVTPILMMVPVQVAMSKKAVIVIAFSFRLTVIAATIARLFYIIPLYPAHNFTFDTVNVEILNEIVLSFSITTACIPCLKPFLDAFDSGFMAVLVEGGRGTGNGSYSGSRSYPLRDMSFRKNLGYSNNKSTVTSNVEKPGDEADNDDMDVLESIKYHSQSKRRTRKPSENSTTIANGGTAYPITEKDDGSVASSSKSDQMIIKKNIEWTVKYEDVDPSAAEEVEMKSHSHAGSARQSQQNLHDQFIFTDHANMPRRHK